jgi:dephospho-CoA kinase
MSIHVFGLTGGIAAGKSTVAARWWQRGLPVADADELARQVVAPETKGLAAAVQLLGRDVLRADGTLDRSLVAARVFADAEARRSLERVLHPLIQEALHARARMLEKQGAALLCYEAPLLVEVGRASLYRPLVVVTASETTQLQRAFKRRHQDEKTVRARIAAQLPMAEKAKFADLLITNDGTVEELHQQADSTLVKVCRTLAIDPAQYGLS